MNNFEMIKRSNEQEKSKTFDSTFCNEDQRMQDHPESSFKN